MTQTINRATACAPGAGIALTAGLGASLAQKFYPDDPISTSSIHRTRRGEKREIDLVYDTLENLFTWPGDPTPNVRAQNVNTVDEVPDSNWYTNRLGSRPMTVDELLKGPDTTSGPAPGTGPSSPRRSTASRPASPFATPRDRCGSSSSIRPAIAQWPPARKSSSPSCSGRSATTSPKFTSPRCAPSS